VSIAAILFYVIQIANAFSTSGYQRLTLWGVNKSPHTADRITEIHNNNGDGRPSANEIASFGIYADGSLPTILMTSISS
jgi:hypothetical protein